MAGMYRTCALGLVAIFVLSSMIMVESASAQTIPKPSVPEFTLKFVDSSTYIQPVYGTDQYTGKSVITQEGYYQQNKSIIVTITNLPFTKALQDQNLTLFYQIEYKGSYGEYWSNLNQTSWNSIYQVSEGKRSLAYPNAPYSIVTLGFKGNNGSAPYGVYNFIEDIPVDGQVDFRLRALIGYFTKVYEYDKYVPGIPGGDPTDPIPHYYAFTGETSDWSNTQTITMSESSSSPTPSPTSPIGTINTGPHMPETEPFPTSTVLVVASILIVVVIASFLLFRRHRKNAKLA